LYAVGLIPAINNMLMNFINSLYAKQVLIPSKSKFVYFVTAIMAA